MFKNAQIVNPSTPCAAFDQALYDTSFASSIITLVDWRPLSTTMTQALQLTIGILFITLLWLARKVICFHYATRFDHLNFIQKKLPANHPPVVQLSVRLLWLSGIDRPVLSSIKSEEIFKDSRVAYEAALKRHGHIIAVPRKNRVRFFFISQGSSHRG